MARWEGVRPILVAAYELMDESPNGTVAGQALADRFGRDRDRDATWDRDLRALHDAGYINAYFSAMGPELIQGTEKGRQEVEGWPGPRTEAGSAELLLALIEQTARDKQLSEEEREKVGGLLRAAREAGVDLVAKVASEFAYRASGLG